MKLIGEPTSYDAILQFMQDQSGQTVLSAKEQEMLKRWQDAYNMLRNYQSFADVVPMLMKMHGVSRATAYRDCQDALKLFGEIAKSNKEGIRHLSTEMLWDAIRMAYLQKKPKDMIAGVKELSEIHGLKKEDPDMPDFETLQPPILEVALPAETQMLLEQLTKVGPVNLNELRKMILNNMASDAQEVKHED